MRKKILDDFLYIGVTAFGHDSAAAVLTPENNLFAAEEERFSRIKHERRFPVSALSYCLEAAKKRSSDIGRSAFRSIHDNMAAGFYHDPWLHAGDRLKHVLRHLPASARFLFSFGNDVSGWKSMFGAGRRIKGVTGRKIIYLPVEHHTAHAAGAFFTSPFHRAAIATIDGMGEWTTTTTGYGEGNRIYRFGEAVFPHSLGIFYKTLTAYLGFRPDGDEYKVMGLSSYGEPEYAEEFRRIVFPWKDGFFRLNLDYFSFHLGSAKYFSALWEKRLGKRRLPEEKIRKRHANIAKSAQVVLEEVVLLMLEKLKDISGESNLAVSGGVALNSAMNGAVREKAPFDNIWFQPPSGDSGTAAGICYYLKYVVRGVERNVEPLEHLYIGPSFSREEIDRVVERADLASERCNDQALQAARLIASGAVIGWFQDGMEFGPRALGNRSILADPGRPEMKDHLNEVVKKRESFRPFAPSILSEVADEYFVSPGNAGAMLYTVRARGKARRRMPAVVHVDGTSRVHTVRAEDNSLFHRLLTLLGTETGLGAVLNTSFNLRDEPIVCSPADALDTFSRSELDCVIIGDRIVAKSETELRELKNRVTTGTGRGSGKDEVAAV